jgi:hypothetical protein
MISRARGLEAWDADGVVYRRVVPEATRTQAGRAVKREAKVGILLDWGEPEIEWVDIPSDPMKVRAAETFVDDLCDRAAQSSPPEAEIRRSIWQARQEGRLMLLVESIY